MQQDPTRPSASPQDLFAEQACADVVPTKQLGLAGSNLLTAAMQLLERCLVELRSDDLWHELQDPVGKLSPLLRAHGARFGEEAVDIAHENHLARTELSSNPTTRPQNIQQLEIIKFIQTERQTMSAPGALNA